MLHNQRDRPYLVTEADMRETLEYISNYSLYAYEQEMKQGFITIEGGHRVGMAGQVILEDGHVKNLKYVSSVNVRMSHEVQGVRTGSFLILCRKRKSATHFWYHLRDAGKQRFSGI